MRLTDERSARPPAVGDVERTHRAILRRGKPCTELSVQLLDLIDGKEPHAYEESSEGLDARQEVGRQQRPDSPAVAAYGNINTLFGNLREASRAQHLPDSCAVLRVDSSVGTQIVDYGR